MYKILLMLGNKFRLKKYKYYVLLEISVINKIYTILCIFIRSILKTVDPHE